MAKKDKPKKEAKKPPKDDGKKKGFPFKKK